MKVSRRQPYVGRSIKKKVGEYRCVLGTECGASRCVVCGRASGFMSNSCIVLVRIDGWSVGIVSKLHGGWTVMSIWSVGVEFE